MSRAVASLLLSVAAWVLIAFVMRGTLALYGAIFALMLGFAGTFAGFVANDGAAPRRERGFARGGIAVGCLALVVGSWMFLRSVLVFSR